MSRDPIRLNGQAPEAEKGREAKKENGGLSAALIAELTSHKTVAERLTLAKQPAVALVAVTHALTLSALYSYGSDRHSSLGIKGTVTTFPMAISKEVTDAMPRPATPVVVSQ